MCFYSAPWPSYYIAHSLQLPVVFKLIRNLNVMASQLKKTKKKKRHKVQKKSVTCALELWDLFHQPGCSGNKSATSVLEASNPPHKCWQQHGMKSTPSVKIPHFGDLNTDIRVTSLRRWDKAFLRWHCTHEAGDISLTGWKGTCDMSPARPPTERMLLHPGLEEFGSLRLSCFYGRQS